MLVQVRLMNEPRPRADEARIGAKLRDRGLQKSRCTAGMAGQRPVESVFVR